MRAIDQPRQREDSARSAHDEPIPPPPPVETRPRAESCSKSLSGGVVAADARCTAAAKDAQARDEWADLSVHYVRAGLSPSVFSM